MISYFFRFVSLLVIMQVGGGGEHVNKADARRGAGELGAEHANMQGWLGMSGEASVYTGGGLCTL